MTMEFEEEKYDHSKGDVEDPVAGKDNKVSTKSTTKRRLLAIVWFTVLFAVAVIIFLFVQGKFVTYGRHPKEDEHQDHNSNEKIVKKESPKLAAGMTSPRSEEQSYYIDSRGPLPAKIHVMNPDVVSGYISCDDLKEDIANALMHLANTIIMDQKDDDCYEQCNPEDPYSYCGRRHYGYGGSAESSGGEEPKAMAKGDGSAGRGGGSGDGAPLEDSFETNNQVFGVDEADIVKSDGNWVFAGYSDLLFVWNATNGTAGHSKTRLNFDTRKRCRKVEGRWNRQQCLQSKPRIISLLLHEKRLTAIVSEETYYHYYGANRETRVNPIFSDSKISIQVYDVSRIPTDGSPLELLGKKIIFGNYESARSLGSVGVVITSSYVRTYEFTRELYRYQPQYCGLNTAQYIRLATNIALEKIDPFAERMVNEMQIDGDCRNIFQIFTLEGSHGNVLENLVQVLSFDMDAYYLDEEITTEVAGAFTSGYLKSVYVSQDFVGTLNVDSGYNRRTQGWDQTTFILGFNVSGTIPVPFCIGEVPGSPINQYAVDLQEGHLRIATTTSTWSRSLSRTENRIYVLKVPKENEERRMQLTGVTDHLGKKDESIYAVRFIGDKAYVVTFERIDPFIIVDVSDHADPHVVGELEIPGYSSYLHQIEIDGVEIILGVGQHVDVKRGSAEGVKICLFNITDASHPTEMATYIDRYAHSDAEHDFKSFRYLPVSQKLILPKSEWTRSTKGNFDGFSVYDINMTAITPTFEIKHADSRDIYDGCWYDARMPPRSLVFKSKITTLLSHTVLSTDLHTGVQEWKLNLDEGLEMTECSTYWGYHY